MRRQTLVISLLFAAIGGILLLAWGTGSSITAAQPPDVVVMRCTPMGEPYFSYQVSTFSATEEIPVEITASEVMGEGDDCADAISRLVAAGINQTKLSFHASAEALVVTGVDR